MFNRFLFKPINNVSLVLFRIILGALIAIESFGAIATGWVKRVFIEPQFTFSFIGFEWLQPFEGFGMYYYYIIMGLLGICISAGYKYRWSMLSFAFLWSASYLMQKSSYNNHYYLLMLIAFVMSFLPANKRLSMDVKIKPEMYSSLMPNWCLFIIIFQLWIVYTFGALAKIYPDWLNGTTIGILMQNKADYFLIGNLLQSSNLQWFLTYGGILFDGLIIPILLFKPTRIFGVVASFFFHLFNAVVFQIGIFPFLSLGFLIFFIQPETLEKTFLKPKNKQTQNLNFKYKKLTKFCMVTYLIIQIILPLRHWFIKDDVLWTEEGHRLAWRMMLRAKTGISKVHIFNHSYNRRFKVNLNDYLTAKQQKNLATKPDFMWQFAQHLKKEYAKKGDSISVYIQSKVSVNGKPYKPFIDSKKDLAATSWNHFKHHPWILPSKAP